MGAPVGKKKKRRGRGFESGRGKKVKSVGEEEFFLFLSSSHFFLFPFQLRSLSFSVFYLFQQAWIASRHSRCRCSPVRRQRR